MSDGWRRPHARAARDLTAREVFGLSDARTLARDLRTLVADALRERRIGPGLARLGHVRPDLALPAWRGLVPTDELAPILALFDRAAAGAPPTPGTARRRPRDFRGRRLTVQGHAGTDFVCPPGTPLLASAPGVVVLIRQDGLRGGLTVGIDHGRNIITHVSHCAVSLVRPGQAVQRGEPVAWSGASGAELLRALPWVPPHVHFMVWSNGIPVDPFLVAGDTHRNATWTQRNTPLPADAVFDPTEPVPEPSGLDEAAFERVLATCGDPALRAELEAAYALGAPHAAALAEELLHHRASAWSARLHGMSVRPPAPDSAPPIRVAMPLPSVDYRGAAFADARWPAFF